VTKLFAQKGNFWGFGKNGGFKNHWQLIETLFSRRIESTAIVLSQLARLLWE